MGEIDRGRVLLGGIAAGIVIDIGELVSNMLLFHDTWEQMVADYGLAPLAGGALVALNLLGLVLGIGLVWLYAAIRPRYGAGPQTAVCAGLAVWGFYYLLPTVGAVLAGFFAAGPMVGPVLFGAVELLIAALVGGALYREEQEPEPRPG